jgi:hypothetical protein
MKSWQTFSLVFGFPLAAQFFLMFFIVDSNNPDPQAIFKIMPIFTFVFMVIFLSWFWGLGTGLNKYVAEEIRPSPNLFKFGLIYSGVYIILFLVVMMDFSNNNMIAESIAIIFPLHMLSMVCMFYGLYFISKNLVMAERNNKVKFSSFSREFFLIWFLPIGIWFIQPRINKLYEKNHQ